MSSKYNRTFHIPSSRCIGSDDKVLNPLSYKSILSIEDGVITEKMDGECTTMTGRVCHARSIESGYHESRTLVKALHGSIKHNIPDGYRIVGENLYAKHSIHYNNLKSFFQVFAIFDEKDIVISYDAMVLICDTLGLDTVPVMYRGTITENDIKIAEKLVIDNNRNPSNDVMEGFVIRNCNQFSSLDFSSNVGKWVRENHVEDGSEHWSKTKVIKNKLRNKQ